MPTLREDGERPARRRATMSCDRCKSRKTKCVNPVPGPCQYCASIDAPCRLDSRRRQRPYYRVSEEEFRCMTRLLEHFLPDTELNLQNLRACVESLDSIPVPTILTPSASVTTSSTYTLPNPQPVPEGRGDDDDASITEEMSELFNELGKIRLDPRGIPRYVAPGAAYLFHSTVRSMKDPRSPATVKNEILAPLASQVASPPSSGSPLATRRAPFQVNLPRRDLCNRCVARFFRDVNSVYWLFSTEQLHFTLDRLYGGDATSATPATLCALYSILALTCESEMQQEWSDSALRPSVTYLALAKALTPALYDDADSDSIRGLCLLSLALSASMCVNTAYVYIGAAVRMALTLGWHVNENATPRHDLREQVDLRLFCTLYTLDLDVSLTFGSPTAVCRSMMTNTPEAPFEQLLGPGSHMPLDYLDTTCQLAHLRRGLTSLLYKRPAARPTQVLVSNVSKAISGLEEWYSNMPSHLKDLSKVAKFHERSVGVLHLRYWNAVIYASRPFLLYSAWKRDEAAQSPKQKWFREFGAKCIDAARKSLEVLEFLRARDLLSSLIILDGGCILDNMQVFLLALIFSDPLVHKQNLVACLRTLQAMEPVFWTRSALAEVTAQLQERGILNQDQELDLGNDECPGLIFLEFSQQGENAFYPDFDIPDLQAMLSREEEGTDTIYGL